MPTTVQSYLTDIETNEIVLYIVPEVKLPQLEIDLVKFVT